MSAKIEYFEDSRDGRRYKCVRIGSQVWMAENLSFTIDNAIGCYYENDEKYKKYGRLYDWVEALSIAPEGWHLPTKEEWETMTAFIGGDGVEGKKLKADSPLWKDNGNGTDEYGFSALPGGYGYSFGSFDNVGGSGSWWSANEYDSRKAYYRDMLYSELAYWDHYYKSYLFSVRCLRD